jgi:hypothetical protein
VDAYLYRLDITLMAQEIAKTHPVTTMLAVKGPVIAALLQDKSKRTATNFIASSSWR